jgi:WD40 repeat protein
MRVTGLPEEACRTLLADQSLTGMPGDAAALARRYGGNPLALKLVTEPIRVLFSGDIAAFLSKGTVFFEGVGQLLEQQINRASILEQALLVWLAIGRESVGLNQLMGNLREGSSRAAVLAALHALWRRNLIERGQENLAFALQRVVLEYLTERLTERVVDEIMRGDFDALRRYALVQATTKDYVRHSQERLIAAPLLERLVEVYGGDDAVEQRLVSLLATWHDQPLVEQGYGPGNVINLLRLLRGHLRGLDLTGLALRQTYLQGVEMQDSSLAGAMMRDSVFTGTFDTIMGIAISRTGKYWAAASQRGEVQIWAASDQTLHRIWQAHTDLVWPLTFSPDGNKLATGSWDGTVKLWDVASGTLLWSGRHASDISSVDYAPDGSMLVSSGNDATILWDLKSGRQMQTLPHPVMVISVAWSPDGKLLASGDVAGNIRLWAVSETELATCVQTLTGHTKLVAGLAFAPDSQTLASASSDGTVKLWDTSTPLGTSGGSLLETLTGHTERVHRVAWSPDGRTLASAGFEKTIWLWDVEQHNYRTALQGHTDVVTGLAFTPAGDSLLSSGDSTVRVWDIASGRCRWVLQGDATALFDIDWSPDGTRLVSGGSDSAVMIHDVTGETPSRTLRGHHGLVFGVGWSPNDQWLASGSWDTNIRIWNPLSGDCVEVLNDPDDPKTFFCGVGWSPDGRRLAGAIYLNPKGVLIWDLSTHISRWVSQAHPTPIRRVAWSPAGRWR